MIVQTLGTAQIDTGKVRLTPVAAKKFALLLYLSAVPENPIRRSLLQSLLYPELPSSNASHSLRALIYKLRQDGVPFVTDTYSVGISRTDLSADWQTIGVGGQISNVELGQLEGGFLPGYSPTISEGFAEWYDPFRAEVVCRLSAMLLKGVDAHKKQGNWALTERFARACLGLDPLNTRAIAALAEMLAIGGSPDRALSLLGSYDTGAGAGASQLVSSLKRLRKAISEQAKPKYAFENVFEFGGRENEISRLSSLFEAVRHGASRACLLVGEPGIGKSRIVSEFASFAALEGASIARANAHPHDVAVPKGTIVELIRSLLELPGALGCSPGSMDWLKALVDAHPNTEARRSAEETSYAICRSILDLADAVSAEGPLILVVDDAQWADETSLRLLSTIARRERARQILLILCTRDERRIVEVESWGDGLAIVTVDPLSKPATMAIVTRALTSLGCTDHTLSEWMVDIASGNPFFAECLINHYRTTGEHYSIPRELNAVLDRRIIALTPDARDLLEIIVALGRHATPGRIEQMVDRHGTAALQAARELEVNRLIVVDSAIRASHSLIAESVQRNSTPLAQAIVYRRMAMALQSELPTSRDSRELWECAQAWVMAGESQRAAELIAECADRCVAIGHSREAAVLSIRAAELAHGEQREALSEKAIRLAHDAGEPSLILRAFELLNRDTYGAHDDLELARLVAQLRLDVDIPRTVAGLVDCLRAHGADIGHRLSAAIALLAFCDQNRQVDTVVTFEHELLELIQTQSPEHEIDRLLCALIYSATFGDSREVPPICEQLLQIASNSRADVAADLIRKAAAGLGRCGLTQRSIDLLERSYKLSSEIGLTRLAQATAVMLAAKYLDLGFEASAQPWLNRIDDANIGQHDYYLEFSRLLLLAEVAFWRRDLRALSDIRKQLNQTVSRRDGIASRRLKNTLQVAIQSCEIASGLIGDLPDVSTIASQLISHHVAGYELGELSDFEVAVSITVLGQKNLLAEAYSLLTHYLDHVRRPGLVLSFSLVAAAASVGLDLRNG